MKKTSAVIVICMCLGMLLSFTAGCQRERRSEVVFGSDLLTFYHVPEDTLAWMSHCLNVKSDSVISMFAFSLQPYPHDADTLLYNVICKMTERDCYEGSMQAVYKWFWHDAVKKDVDDYLSLKSSGLTLTDSMRYELVMKAICDSVSRIDTYEDCAKNALAHAVATVSVWRMMDKYKEMIRKTGDVRIKRAYLEDCQLWLALLDDAKERLRDSGEHWGVKVNRQHKRLAEFRARMLDEEMAERNTLDSIWNWDEYEHRFLFDNTETALEAWYEGRMQSAKGLEGYSHSFFRNLSGVIVERYKAEMRLGLILMDSICNEQGIAYEIVVGN